VLEKEGGLYPSWCCSPLHKLCIVFCIIANK
jgi:hypothetical protein